MRRVRRLPSNAVWPPVKRVPTHISYMYQQVLFNFHLQGRALGNFSVACACALVVCLSQVLLISFHRVISFVAANLEVGLFLLYFRVSFLVFMFFNRVGRVRPLIGNGQSGTQTHTQPSNLSIHRYWGELRWCGGVSFYFVSMVPCGWVRVGLLHLWSEGLWRWAVCIVAAIQRTNAPLKTYQVDFFG
jgi:hypothetical protein